MSSELELVALYPLTVQEGGVAVITTQNIDVILDHHKYGVRPSGVLLHVAQSPQHGRIAVDLTLQRNLPQYNFIEGEKSKQFFTLMDLSRDKVFIAFIFIFLIFQNFYEFKNGSGTVNTITLLIINFFLIIGSLRSRWI